MYENPWRLSVKGHKRRHLTYLRVIASSSTGQDEGESEEAKVATVRVTDGCEATWAVSASRRAPGQNLGLPCFCAPFALPSERNMRIVFICVVLCETVNNLPHDMPCLHTWFSTPRRRSCHRRHIIWILFRTV